MVCLSATASFAGLWPSDVPSVCPSSFSLPSSVRHPLSCVAERFESVPALSEFSGVSVGSRDFARSEGEESSERGVDCLDASFTRPAV